MNLIAPSILSCDFSKIGEEVESCQKAGADLLHVDVMDGCFVRNITIGPPVVKAIRACTPLTLDVHLMIDKPLRYIPQFLDAGADIITFHVEAGSPVDEVISLIKKASKTAGIAISPNTPYEVVLPYLNEIGMVLVMSVEPGFGGQCFCPFVLPKVEALRAEIENRGLNVAIEIDGGINDETIADAKKAGANVFVSGSFIFKSNDRKAAIEKLRAIANG